MQNSPARLPDVGLGPRVGLPGRRQPAGYGTSWSVLVSSTSGPIRFLPTESISPFSIHEPSLRQGSMQGLLGYPASVIGPPEQNR